MFRKLMVLSGMFLVFATNTAQATVVGINSHGSSKAKHSKRFNVVVELKQGILKHSLSKHLSKHVFAIEAAAFKHKISPFAIVAISGVESSFGHVPCRNNPRNIWGLGACDRVWQVPYFNTWKEAFSYYALFLKRTWPRASTVYELYGYCNGCSSWAYEVSSIMRQLWNVGSSVRYPR